MKIKSILFLSLLFITVLACKSKPSEENLSKILKSNKSTVHLVHSRGGIAGNSAEYDSEERFEIINKDSKTQVKYFTPAYHSDSIFKFDLTNNEADSLVMILKQAVQTHSSYKKYGGCCMCSNVDFYVSNNTIKIEIKPSEEVEDLYYKLINKYDQIVLKTQKEYFDKRVKEAI